MKKVKKIFALICLTLSSPLWGTEGSLDGLPPQGGERGGSWVGTWATAPEFTGQGDMPRTTTLANCSLREIVRVSIGGDTLRLQLSNEFSQQPVEIKAVYIADAKDSCDIDVRTARYLTFAGRKAITIAPGEATFSDALPYSLQPLQRLAVTIVYGAVPENATSHRGSRTTSYIMPGVAKPKARFASTEKVDHWYNIAAIDVLNSPSGAIAILGNSITDGRGSTTNAQNRWPDALATALQGQWGVLNLGIGGNCVIKGGLSEPGVKRFDRDILGQRGVKTLIIFEGVNDIGGSRTGFYEQTALDLIEAYRQFITKAHERGLKVWLCTITPFGRSFYASHFHEAARQTVNDWIRENAEADGMIDFDALVRDPQCPQQLQEQYSDDWLHLNPAGYEAMGRFAADCLQ